MNKIHVIFVMGLKAGIIGLPNVGKSTIFNALTKATIPAENYPFCTIDPNVGIVQVPDQRLNDIADIFKQKPITPAIVELDKPSISCLISISKNDCGVIALSSI